MESSNRFNSTERLALPRTTHRHAARSGKITIVTIFAILGLIVMAGYVGNVGHVVTTKIYTQNAADAIAFSSAQWMARGMNSVTATNDLIGEATGMVVAIEALGGRESADGMEAYPDEANTVDKANRQLVNVAKMIEAPEYGAIPFPVVFLDNQIVDKAINTFISPDDDTKKFKAFATIYDSKFTIKQTVTAILIGKTVANVFLLIPPPWGYPTGIAALVAHIAMDAVLVEMATEYIFLDGLELVAPPLGIIKKAIEKTVVPPLAANGDFLAGKNGVGAIVGGPVVPAVTDELRRLTDVYHTDTAIFPIALTLRLPIEAEPEPSGNPTSKNESEWGSDDFVPVDPKDFLGDLPSSPDDQKQAVKDQIAAYQKGLDQLKTEEDNIDTQLKKGNELSADEQTKFKQEKTDIGTSRTFKQDRIAELNRKLKDMQTREDENKAAMKNLPPNPSTTGNISANFLPTDKMQESEERYTQWVRATYPYVDSYRAPILAQFHSVFKVAKADVHYRKWSDRYTLTNAWKFRAGYRFQGTSGSDQGQWISGSTRLHMYVMTGAFAKSGERRDQKGHETWTKDDNKGKSEAEKMFTLIGITQRDMTPLFSPRVFPLATDDGMTTFAQAIFYNANDQEPDPIKSTKSTQAKVGWDTLNWDPGTPAPEWGASPHTSGEKWPWELFTGDPMPPITKVKLNWQAKLMPVTESRFDDAAVSALANKSMLKNLVKARPFFKQLVTH